MSDTTQSPTHQEDLISKVDQHARTLKDALRDVREERVDIEDTVLETRAAERVKLSELVDELHPLISDIDPKDDRFEFMIGNGMRPRLWVDMTTFVAMDSDSQTYRLLKDTRLGRMVLAQDDNVQTMGDVIARYIAEKIIEREQEIEGDWIQTKDRALQASEQTVVNEPVTQTSNAVSSPGTTDADNQPVESVVENQPAKRRTFFGHISAFISGVLVTIVAAIAAAWAFLPDVYAQIIAVLGLS